MRQIAGLTAFTLLTSPGMAVTLQTPSVLTRLRNCFSARGTADFPFCSLPAARRAAELAWTSDKPAEASTVPQQSKPGPGNGVTEAREEEGNQTRDEKRVYQETRLGVG